MIRRGHRVLPRVNTGSSTARCRRHSENSNPRVLSKEESWRHRYLGVESLYSDMTCKFNAASADAKQARNELKVAQDELAYVKQLLRSERRIVAAAVGVCVVARFAWWWIEDERRNPSPYDV